MTAHPTKKRVPWIEIIVTSLVIALTVFTIFLMRNKEDTPSPKDTTASKPEEQSTVESSKFPGIRIISEMSNDSHAPFAIQYPQTDFEEFNNAVTSYIQEAKTTYLKSMDEQSHNKGELNISFEIHPHASGVYSFILVEAMYSGGDRGSTKFHTFHFDKESGKQLTMKDVITDQNDSLSRLSQMIRTHIKKDPSLDGKILEEEMLAATKPEWSTFDKFVITDEALLFYFDECQFTADTAGAPIVSIPLKSINSLLKDPFKVAVADPPTSDGDTKQVDSQPNTPNNAAPDKTKAPSQNGKKRIALTFDDGPHPKVTPQVLAILKKHNAKATFFMLGSRVEHYPDVVKEIYADGHEIGNHSWNHPNLTKLTPEGAAQEIQSTSHIIEQILGVPPTVFRPPYGATNEIVSAQTSLPFIMWSVDTLDWKYKNPGHLLQSVKKNASDGGIVLMHDIHQSTADGLEAILQFLQSNGYEFVTISELNQ